MFCSIVFAAETGMESTVTVSNTVDKFNTIVETLQNMFLFLCFIITAILIFLAIVNTRKRSVRFTKGQISAFKENRKYIPGIFIELNESKEVLRYFLFGKKWKHRIIRRFNYIYDNVYGEILKKGTIEENIRFHLNSFASLQDIENTVDTCLDYHNRFRDGKVHLKPEYSESEVLFEIIHYPFSEALEELKNETRAAANDYLVLTGSAGNGKTNLLCSISELAIKLGQAVVFLNSREIEGDIGTYILNCLHVPEILVKQKNMYYRIVNNELRLKRKRFFIIIDAINENEKDGFEKSIQTFVNEMSSYHQFKIIVSCRNEYYKERYEATISQGIEEPHLVYDLKSESYPQSAIDRLIESYRSCFHYSGFISEAVKTVICQQLLLLRVFFEVNKNSDQDALSIKKHELFAEYVKRIKESCSPNIEKILDAIADSMLESKEFDNVDKSLLTGFSDKDINKAFDETILLNKTLVIQEKTIARQEKEVVYFVFDEIRDYYLARRIMQIHTDKNAIDGNAILDQLQEIRDAKASCEEGVIHYAYVFFRTADDIEPYVRKGYCEKILDFYRIKDDYQGFYYHRHHREEFLNYGMKIIFTSGLTLTDYEIKYVQDCLRKEPYEDGGKLFDIALKGTQVGLSTDLDLYYDILFGLKDKKEIINAYHAMFAHAELAGIDLPFDLIPAHRNIVSNYPDRALQIQKAAELYMIMFYDEKREHELQDYFCGLSNHAEVKNEMLLRLQQAIGEQ